MSNAATSTENGLGTPWHESATTTLPASSADRIKAGRDLRGSHPIEQMAKLAPRTHDALAILDEQNKPRLQDLVPLRTARMSQSPFAFYRGTAAIMAADLAGEPHTGILVPSCGDAHVANFGFYATQLRTLVFDLNDFDEAAWAPWEWDLKRLVTSIVIAGQATARDEGAIERAVLSCVRYYARTLRSHAELAPVQRFYTRLDAEGSSDGLPPASQKVLRKAVKHAKKKTGERATQKLTSMDDQGVMRFTLEPPTMTPLDTDRTDQLRHLMRRYLESASPDVQQLMLSYRIVDAVRRVVGVGSVGTRCSLVLLQDGDSNALIMQSKQASVSVLEQFGGIGQPRMLHDLAAKHGQGARVVAMQRILQASSDPFLGHLQIDDFDLYVRQFHDMKGGIDAETLDDDSFRIYAQACGVTLARAHGQTPLAAIVSGYLGGGRSAGKALLQWAYAYAQRAGRDYEDFVSQPVKQ